MNTLCLELSELHRICIDSTCRPLRALSPSIDIFIKHVYQTYINETLPLLTVLQETPYTHEQIEEDVEKEEEEQAEPKGKKRAGGKGSSAKRKRRTGTRARPSVRTRKAKRGGRRRSALIPPHLRDIKSSLSKILSRCNGYPLQQINDIKSAHVLITETFKTYERLAFQVKTLRHTAETAPTSIL